MIGTGSVTVQAEQVELSTGSSEQGPSAPVVALASSFRAVWPELMEAYTSSTGESSAKSSFGSSGLLTTQIRHGAPFELFLSADTASVDLLINSGKAQARRTTLALGTLSLAAPTRNLVPAANNGLNDLVKAVKEKTQSLKIAMPNPRHAPYGIAARQALSNLGIWPLPDGMVLNAENASQALQYALNGVVDYALVPTALVTATSQSLQVWSIPGTLYEPVEHPMVLLNNAGPSALRLYDWLQSEVAATELHRAGFQPPG